MGRERNGISTGVMLITIGVIFLADRQGFGGFGHLWPLILIVAGLSRMLFPSDRTALRTGPFGDRRLCRESRFNGIGIILVGVIFLLHQNNVLRLEQSWPLFIVAAGIGIIFSGIFRQHDEPPATSTDQSSNSTFGRGGQL
jgi:hypothetical protein